MKLALRNVYWLLSFAFFGWGLYNAWLYHFYEKAGWWPFLLAIPAMIMGLGANLALGYFLFRYPRNA